MSVDERECTKCHETKPLDLFSRAPRGPHGRKARCKACDAARHKANHIPKRPPIWDENDCRRCTKCGERKPRAQFGISTQGVRGPIHHCWCKPCQSAQALAWMRNNRERAKDNKHAWTLRTTYGITVDEYAAMLARQGGVCAICGLDEPAAHGKTGTRYRLSVDHCHEEGRVRGLLCQKCNRAIGLLGDDTDLLRKAIDYLERGRGHIE